MSRDHDSGNCSSNLTLNHRSPFAVAVAAAGPEHMSRPMGNTSYTAKSCLKGPASRPPPDKAAILDNKEPRKQQAQ